MTPDRSWPDRTMTMTTIDVKTRMTIARAVVEEQSSPSNEPHWCQRTYIPTATNAVLTINQIPWNSGQTVEGRLHRLQQSEEKPSRTVSDSSDPTDRKSEIPEPVYKRSLLAIKLVRKWEIRLKCSSVKWRNSTLTVTSIYKLLSNYCVPHTWTSLIS